MTVFVPDTILEQARRIHIRFEEKIHAWIDQVEEHGIHAVSRMKGDHRLRDRFRERRDHIWTTELNHRYRLFYEIVNGEVQVLQLETHNKQRY